MNVVPQNNQNIVFMNSSNPPLLQPLGWCGRQWRALAHIQANSSCVKVCKVILRIVPAILLSIATLFAGMLGLVGCCFSKNHKMATTYNVSLDIGGENGVSNLDGLYPELSQRLSQRYKVATHLEDLTYPKSIGTVFDEPQVAFAYEGELRISANPRQSTTSCWDRLTKAFKEEVPTVSEVVDHLFLCSTDLNIQAKVALWAKDVQRVVCHISGNKIPKSLTLWPSSPLEAVLEVY